MCTVGTAEWGVDSHRVAIVANVRVVFFDPQDPQYNVMGSWGNVEAYGFFITGDVKDEGVEMGDMPPFEGLPSARMREMGVGLTRRGSR